MSIDPAIDANAKPARARARRTPSAWPTATTSPSSPTRAASTPAPCSPSGLRPRRPRAAGPQGRARADRRRRAGRPLRHRRSATAAEAIAAGRWVHERLLKMPAARSLDGLPVATIKPRVAGAARRLHLRRLPQRRRLGRHAQHPRDHDDGAVRRRRRRARGRRASRPSCCRAIPNVDDVVGLEHGYGCGVAIDAPDAQIPIRTLRNISKNPNFGGEIMVVSLGCEKLQPERLLPPGSFAIRDERGEPERRRARRRLPAGRGARRLRVDDRFDHGVGAASTSRGSTRAGARPCRRRRSSSACSAAAATRSRARPPIRRSASAPTCSFAPARR